MSKHDPEPAFPMVVTIRGRNFVWRSHFEHYKKLLTRHALGSSQDPPPPPQIEGDVLVPLKVVSAELGTGRRTIGRRMKESADAAEATAG